MKRNKLLLIGLLFLIIPSVLAIEVSPSSWSTIVTAGGTQNSKVFTFSNSLNTTKSISFTVTGDNPSLLSLSNSSLVIPANSSLTMTATTNVGSLVNQGIYVDYISYDGSSIAVVITVQPNQEQTGGCQLIPSVTNYITRIQSGANPFTKKFSVTVSPACPGYLNIQMPITVGTTFGSDNIEHPLAIGGEISLGQKSPGQTADFDVMFDISSLSSGVYNPYIIVNSLNSSGSRIQTKIEFQITVVSGINPYSNYTSLPTYTVPSSVQSGEIFEISARNVDANLEPSIIPIFGVTGISTTFSNDGTWVWKGYTNRTGNITIQIVTLMKGSQIGTVQSFPISITGAGSLPSSSYMILDFNPSPENAMDNQTVNILCRDSSSRNIIPCTLYLNGALLNASSIVVRSGQSYVVSATNDNYNTNDTLLTVNSPFVKINLPDKIYDNTEFQATTDPQNATLLVDDQIVNKNSVIISTPGVHNIKAVNEGYSTYSSNLTVEESLKVTASTDAQLFDNNKNGIKELSNNKEYTITFNKNDTTYVTYIKKGENQGKQIANSNGLNTLTFKTQGAGTYYVQSANKTFFTYEIVSSSFLKIFWYVIGGIVVLLLLVVILRRRGSGSGGLDMNP